MKIHTRMILARLHRKALLAAAVSALGASAFLAASVMPAQAAPIRTATASHHNVPGIDGSVQPFFTGVIRNYVTGFCLGTHDGHNNTDAVVWRCNGARNQTWSEKYPGQIAQPIKNGNGDCLGVAGGSTRQGAHVVAWTCQPGAVNQLWTTGTGTDCWIGNLQYYVIRNYETGMVIGVSGASTKQGTDLVMWPSQKSPTCNNQYWDWS